jgi:hypothetical protein
MADIEVDSVKDSIHGPIEAFNFETAINLDAPKGARLSAGLLAYLSSHGEVRASRSQSTMVSANRRQSAETLLALPCIKPAKVDDFLPLTHYFISCASRLLEI